MPTAYRPTTIRAELRGTYLGEEVLNGLWFENSTGGPVGTALVAVAVMLRAWWQTNLLPIISNQYVLREIYVADWASATGPTFTSTTSLPASGGNANDPVPGNVAACVTFRSDGRGRSSRGRNFVAGATENVTAGNQFTGPFVTALQGAYATLISDANGIAIPQIVYSQFSNNNVRPVGVASNVVAASVDPNIDSMRRRLAGRGR